MNNKKSLVRIFNSEGYLWEKDREYNHYVVNSCLDYCREQLKGIGFLFLNDVYKKLGLRLTREGQMLGWVYKKLKKERMYLHYI